jgi:hypothetical protein
MADGGIMEAALLSAAIGGGTSLATGQDPLKGALLGAVTGGAGAGIGSLLPGVTGAATDVAVNGAANAGANQALTNAIGNPLTELSGIGAFGQAPELSSLSNVMNNAGQAANAGITNGLGSAVSNNIYPNFAPVANTVADTAGATNAAIDTVNATADMARIPGIGQSATQIAPVAQNANPLTNGIRNLAGISPDSTGYGAKALNYYDTLSPMEKGLGGAAVGYGYGTLTKDPAAMPEEEEYDSPLAGYNRDTFTPDTARPQMPYYKASYAEGGIAGLQNQQGGMYPQSQQANTQYATPSQMPTSAEVVNSGYEPQTNPYTGEPVRGFAAGGGVGSLGGYAHGGNPQLLDGPGTGLSDDIPATIGGKQPARLAAGEFIVSSDVVSNLGGGSTDAGAKMLYEMMDRVRKQAHGTKKQIKPVNTRKVLPA